MKDWKVGDPVVYISEGAFEDAMGDGGDPSLIQIFPQNGIVYTIREIGSNSVLVWIRLNEIIHPVCFLSSGEFGEPAWDARDFKKLDAKRLDQFRVHLNPKRVEERIDA